MMAPQDSKLSEDEVQSGWSMKRSAEILPESYKVVNLEFKRYFVL